MKTLHMDTPLQTFCDILIPGNAEWPSASAALGEISAKMFEDDCRWIEEQSVAVAQAPMASREAIMMDLERSDSERFGRVLSALYGAYYTSAPVHAGVRRLASASPHEKNPYFDETLLERVIATKAGLRRL